MIEVTHTVPTAPKHVFAVLADGWSYPLWVVGATHMRDVDDGWPAVGTRIHHCVGPWPLQIRDRTAVTAMEPERLLELDAAAWPAGTARVRMTLDATGPESTRVTMGEIADSGPASLLPAPVQAALLRARNTEALRRLTDIAVHREAGR